MLDGITNQLALLAERQVDLVLVVLALDVRHVDGDEDVRVLLLEPDQRQDQRGEVGRRLGLSLLSSTTTTREIDRAGRLGGDEGVGGDAVVVVAVAAAEVGELGLGGVPDLEGVDVVGADEVLEVGGQGAAVVLEGVGGAAADALGDVKDDGGEAGLVDVDFLVVGDLADAAGLGLVGLGDCGIGG